MTVAEVEVVGSTTTTRFAAGWQLNEFAGNPLGLQYGGPFRTLTKHLMMTTEGMEHLDPHRVSERIHEIEPVFEAKLAELRAKDEEESNAQNH